MSGGRGQGAGGRAALAALAAVVLIVPVYTQGRGGQAPARAARPDWPPKLEAPAPGEVEILPVQGNVYMLAGAGGNITVQVADQGVLMVDTGTAAMSDKVIKTVQSLAKGKPLRYIINTSHRDDYTGGNDKLAPIGEIVPFREPDYTAGPQIEIYLEHVAVGAALPEMPLFLRPDRYVNVPLEATYQASYRGMPAFWRDVLEGRPPQAS